MFYALSYLLSIDTKVVHTDHHSFPLTQPSTLKMLSITIIALSCLTTANAAPHPKPYPNTDPNGTEPQFTHGLSPSLSTICPETHHPETARFDTDQHLLTTVCCPFSAKSAGWIPNPLQPDTYAPVCCPQSLGDHPWEECSVGKAGDFVPPGNVSMCLQGPMPTKLHVYSGTMVCENFTSPSNPPSAQQVRRNPQISPSSSSSTPSTSTSPSTSALPPPSDIDLEHWCSTHNDPRYCPAPHSHTNMHTHTNSTTTTIPQSHSLLLLDDTTTCPPTTSLTTVVDTPGHNLHTCCPPSHPTGGQTAPNSDVPVCCIGVAGRDRCPAEAGERTGSIRPQSCNEAKGWEMVERVDEEGEGEVGWGCEWRADPKRGAGAGARSLRPGWGILGVGLWVGIVVVGSIVL